MTDYRHPHPVLWAAADELLGWVAEARDDLAAACDTTATTSTLAPWWQALARAVRRATYFAEEFALAELADLDTDRVELTYSVVKDLDHAILHCPEAQRERLAAHVDGADQLGSLGHWLAMGLAANTPDAAA